MKRNIILTALVLFAFGLMSQAQSLNSNQQNLREGIFAFLKKEGFAPKKVTDDKLSFKRDDHDYYVAIDAQKSSPMSVIISTSRTGDYSESAVVRAASSNTSAVKYSYLKGLNRVTMSCGIYLKTVETFNDAFYSWLSDFDEAALLLNPTAQGSATANTSASNADHASTAANLVVTRIELANTHRDNTIVDLYGEELFSDKVMYLKPRVTYVGKTSGDVILRVKWFDTDNKLIRISTNVTAGFSQEGEYNIGIGERNNTLFLNGFGYDNAGRWKPGNYRLEIWQGNIFLKEHSFTIKSRNADKVADDQKLANIANGITKNYSELPVKFPVYADKTDPYFTMNEVKVVKGAGINIIFRTEVPLNSLSIDDRSTYIDACENVFNDIVAKSIEQTKPDDMPTSIDTTDMYFYCLEDVNGTFISGMKF